MEENPKVFRVSQKNFTGVIMHYPECKTSQLFAKIAGTKTLTLKTLEAIISLGYDMQIVKKGHNED